MDRPGLLKRLDTAWRTFQESYAGLSAAELMEPGVTGDWSVRDILAHVTTWEEEALKYLPLILKGGTPPRYRATYGGIDAFNALMTERKRSVPLAGVLRQVEEIHRRLIELVRRTPAGQFARDTRFRRRLRLDTYHHYPQHAEAIRRWRALRPAPGRTYTLLGSNRRSYESATPGTLGGHRPGRRYGRLDCAAALRAIARGGYVEHRVFFADERTAIAAGYRPCGVCLPEEYARWKARKDQARGARRIGDRAAPRGSRR